MANESFHITLTNDGAGNYTTAARRGGTAASAGTALTIPAWAPGSANWTTATTVLHGLALSAAVEVVLDEISLNGK